MRNLCFGENILQITCQNKMSVSSVVFQAGIYNQEPYKLNATLNHFFPTFSMHA